MNRTTWIAAAALSLAAMTLPHANAWASQQSSGRLVQVAPLASDADEVEFSADEWTRRLTDFDLDLREKNFDEIVALARRDSRARTWLRERVADTADPELTWTARLALREVERRGPAERGGVMGVPFFRAHGHRDSAFRDLHGRIEELRERMEEGFLQHGAPLTPGASSQSQSVTIEETPDGVKVAVTKIVDGVETKREYEAESMEALLEANPELEDEIGNGHHSLRFRLGPTDPILDVDGMRLELEQLFEGLDLLPRNAPPPRPADARAMRTDVLGVYVAAVPPALSTRLGLEPDSGLVVHGTMPGTIAHVLGIAPGNVLVELNGTALSSLEQISEILKQRPSDGEVTVVWYDGFGDRRRQTWMPVETGQTQREE